MTDQPYASLSDDDLVAVYEAAVAHLKPSCAEIRRRFHASMPAADKARFDTFLHEKESPHAR
jgi:hypothetical protein